MTFAAGETITVTPQTVGTIDSFGGPTSTPGTPYDVHGCGISPSATEDIEVTPAGSVADVTVYAPPGTVVPTTAVVTVRGEDHTVIGTTRTWRSPHSGTTLGVVIRLQATPAKT